MSTLSETGLAVTADVVIRVSIVLTISLLLALRVTRNVALRHAFLLAGLAAAFVVPAAMLVMQLLPVSRWHLVLLGPPSLGGPVTASAVSQRPLTQSRSESAQDAALATAHTGTGDAEVTRERDASAASDTMNAEPAARSSLSVPYGRPLASGLLCALCAGAVLKLSGLGISLLRLRRIVTRGRPVADEHILAVLGQVQRRIPMPSPPRLLESAEVSAPVAAGVVGDYVLLPTGWAGNLDLDETMAVLGHEAAHLARRDHRVVILQEILASVFWFHPLVYLFNRMLNRSREELCDNHAIAIVDRTSYCEVLLTLAVGRPEVDLRGVTSMWTRRWSLEDRVRGILDDQRLTRTGISKFARSATATCLLLTCGLIAVPQLVASPPDGRIEPAAPVAEPHAPSPRAQAEDGRIGVATKTFTKSFTVSVEKMLRFENLAGRVEIVTGKGPMVEVEATVRVGELAEGEARRIVDDVRWVETPAADGDSRWGLSFPTEAYRVVRYAVSGETKTDTDTVNYLGREVRLTNRKGDSTPSVEFDLRISVPPGVHVAVDNAVGPVCADAVESSLKVSTRHGAIQLGQVRASIDAKSVYGDVMISSLDADAIVHSDHGEVLLSRVSQGHVALSTGSGGSRIDQLPASGFSLQYAGGRPLEVIGGGVARISASKGGRTSEGIVRGTGGPSITVATDTGTATVAVARDGT